MTTVLETRYGAMECFAGDTVVCEALRLYGEWAQLELDLLARIVPAGGTVLDIGAFVGSHTLAFAHMVGPEGQVHSFEPRSLIRRLLQSNVDRNALGQARVHACALGRTQATLNIPAVAADINAERNVNLGGLALREANQAESEAIEIVEIRPLDSFSFDRIDLIKIDAEGMEPEVIGGAQQTIARHRPIIFAECNDLEHGAEMLRALAALDYATFGAVEPAYNPSNFRGNPHNIFGEADEVALLAVPREGIEAWQARGALDGLATIDSVDALALLLLHKAQYPSEVLAASSAAAALGIRYASPLSRMQDADLAQVKAALAACEDQVRVSLQRTQMSECMLSEAQSRYVETQQRFRDTETRMSDTELVARAADDRARLAEEHAMAAVERAHEAEQRAREAGELLLEAEAELRLLEQRALAAEHYRATSLRWWLGQVRRRLFPSRRP
jgi:FkbM family methyltransferase